MPSIILSDNGVSSGSAGLKSTAASDGALALQTTTAGGTATTAVSIDTSQNVTFAKGISNGLNISGAGWGVLPYVANSTVIDNNSGQTRIFATGADASTYGTMLMYAGTTNGSATLVGSVGRNLTFALQGATQSSGTGIAFPATQSASSDANTLDDYEEGTWTPTIGLGTFTYGSARYTKVGRIVTVSAYCQNFSDRSTASNLAIGGLPFASASSGSDAVGSLFMRYTNNPVTAVYISTNTSTILFYGSVSGNYANLLHSNLNNSLAEIYFTITYTTNT